LRNLAPDNSLLRRVPHLKLAVCNLRGRDNFKIGEWHATKLRIIVHDFAHQLFDQLLADNAVLAAGEFCDRLLRFIKVPTVKPATVRDGRISLPMP
jgi:hypothetical protein